MKTLKKSSTSIFLKIIAKLAENTHLKIDANGPDSGIMPLIVEKLGQPVQILSTDYQIYSLAHYYTQCGDLIADPDMTFAVNINNPDIIYPLTIQNPMFYSEGLFMQNGKWLLNKPIQADMTSFANQWLKNLKWQQNL